MVELTKRERRLTSFPTRKITEEEARKSLSRAVANIQIAWYELEQAKLELNNAISHLRDSYSLHNTERLERASKWVHSANTRYYQRRSDLSVVKDGCYESEIPSHIVKEYTEVLEKCENS